MLRADCFNITVFSSRTVIQLWTLCAEEVAASRLVLVVVVFSGPCFPRFGDQDQKLIYERSQNWACHSSFLCLFLYLLMPDGFMSFPAFSKEELISSQYHLLCFLVCKSSFSCSMYVFLSISNPMCYLTLCLAIFVSSIPQACNFTHLW